MAANKYFISVTSILAGQQLIRKSFTFFENVFVLIDKLTEWQSIQMPKWNDSNTYTFNSQSIDLKKYKENSIFGKLNLKIIGPKSMI